MSRIGLHLYGQLWSHSVRISFCMPVLRKRLFWAPAKLSCQPSYTEIHHHSLPCKFWFCASCSHSCEIQTGLFLKPAKLEQNSKIFSVSTMQNGPFYSHESWKDLTWIKRGPLYSRTVLMCEQGVPKRTTTKVMTTERKMPLISWNMDQNKLFVEVFDQSGLRS